LPSEYYKYETKHWYGTKNKSTSTQTNSGVSEITRKYSRFCAYSSSLFLLTNLKGRIEREKS